MIWMPTTLKEPMNNYHVVYVLKHRERDMCHNMIGVDFKAVHSEEGSFETYSNLVRQLNLISIMQIRTILKPFLVLLLHSFLLEEGPFETFSNLVHQLNLVSIMQMSTMLKPLVVLPVHSFELETFW